MTSKPRGALWATKYLVFQIVKSWDVRICEEKYAVGSGHSSGAKVQKSCSVMTSVYEFQKSSKKVGNGFRIWISKIYEKIWLSLQYMNFNNLRKKLVMASVYELQKSTKKVGYVFSIWISKIYGKNLVMASVY